MVLDSRGISVRPWRRAERRRRTRHACVLVNRGTVRALCVCGTVGGRTDSRRESQKDFCYNLVTTPCGHYACGVATLRCLGGDNLTFVFVSA